jgi:dTDP-4-dehydrorhamnose reductase
MLGREVVRALRSAGADVGCAGRRTEPGWIGFDAERDDVRELFRVPVGLVVNCAGVLASEIDPDDPASVRRAQAVNAQFPNDLAQAALASSARLVHVSTDAIFRRDAGRCLEDCRLFAQDVYGATKRLGEPDLDNSLSLRVSFVGLDPARRRGIVEWLRRLPARSRIEGFVDQAWNGLVTTQVARVCASLLDPAVFDAARLEGESHHLFEDPPLTKRDVVAMCALAFGLDLEIVPSASGDPSTRVLGTRHAVLSDCLESGPPRALAIESLARRETALDA